MVVGERGFAVGNGGELQGFDVANGKSTWVGVSGGALITVTASQDAAYLSSEGGEPLWELGLNTLLLAPALPYEKSLLVANEAGEMIQLVSGGDDNELGCRSPFVEIRGE